MSLGKLYQPESKIQAHGTMHNTIAYKQILTVDEPVLDTNYVVMASYGQFVGALAFVKPGNKVWTCIDISSDGQLIDDIIYYEDKFYVVDNDGRVFSCNLRHPSPSLSVVAPGPDLFGKKYLVELCGDLLQIVRDLEFGDDFRAGYVTVGFTVFKLDRLGANWIEVKSLGGRILFLGDNSSMSLSVSDMLGCKPNGIYFTDDMHCGFYNDLYGIHPYDMGVFSMEDRSIELHYPMESKVILPAPTWIEPSL